MQEEHAAWREVNPSEESPPECHPSGNNVAVYIQQRRYLVEFSIHKGKAGVGSTKGSAHLPLIFIYLILNIPYHHSITTNLYHRADYIN
jgi:hypothetical protein